MNIIGLDIGTTSISAAWLDTENSEVKKTFTVANKGFIQTENDWERIQDPEIITDTAITLMDEILDACPEVGVIGLTGQMHGIVYVDAEGRSVSPLYTWQDGRGNLAEDGKSLCEALAEKHGTPFYTGYGLVTHLYNVRHGLVPEKAAKVCTIMDYLGMKMTGRCTPMVHTSDAASFGFYDIRGAKFREDVLAAEAVDTSILPEISAAVEILGNYKGIPVTIAIGDNQASFLGSIRKGREEILINMGTGGQISLYTDEILEGEDIETRPLLDDSYLAVGSSLCGGRSYALLADFFKACAEEMGVEGFDPYAMMDGMLKAYGKKDPVKVNTSFAGTRDYPERRGSVTNITTNNFTPADLTYGMLDGIADELFTRYQTMLDGKKGTHTMMVGSGNGMRRNIHLQNIMKEKFGMELELSTKTEEASCGTAIAGYSAVSGRTWKEEIGI